MAQRKHKNQELCKPLGAEVHAKMKAVGVRPDEVTARMLTPTFKEILYSR